MTTSPAARLVLWRLIDRGSESIPWCEQALRSADTERIEDAAAVLAWIGTPDWLVTRLKDLIDRYGDSQVSDTLQVALPRDLARSVSGDDPDDVPEVATGIPLNGTHDPFTQTIYFVRSSFAEVLADLERWGDELTRRTGRTELHGNLGQLLRHLEPACIPSWKVLYVDTAAEWTVVFSQGSDLSYVANFGRRLNTVVVRTDYSPHIVRNSHVVRYGGTSLWITDGRRDDLGPLHELRVIQASRQSSRLDLGASRRTTTIRGRLALRTLASKGPLRPTSTERVLRSAGDLAARRVVLRPKRDPRSRGHIPLAESARRHPERTVAPRSLVART